MQNFSSISSITVNAKIFIDPILSTLLTNPIDPINCIDRRYLRFRLYPIILINLLSILSTTLIYPIDSIYYFNRPYQQYRPSILIYYRFYWLFLYIDSIDLMDHPYQTFLSQSSIPIDRYRHYWLSLSALSLSTLSAYIK